MPIPLPLLQKTINYIASECLYRDSKEGLVSLSTAYQRRLATDILNEVSPFIYQHTNIFVIGRGNEKLKGLFASLEKDNIVFPQASYLLYHDGISHQKSNGQNVEVVNLKKGKSENKALIQAASALLAPPKEPEFDLIKKLSALTLKSTTTASSQSAKLVTPVVTPQYSSLRLPTLGEYFPPEWQHYFGIKPKLARSTY